MAEQSFTATIAVVKPEPRKWENTYGSCAVQVVFEDGTEGEVMAKLDSYQKHVDALTSLKGKPTEFSGEFNDRFSQWKITQYPGKPASGGGGQQQRREYVVPYHQTAEGVAYEQERSDRRTAVMQAIKLKIGGQAWDAEKPDESAKDTAKAIFTWIRATSHQVQPAQPAPAAPEPAASQPEPSSNGGGGDDELASLRSMAIEKFGSQGRVLTTYKRHFGTNAAAASFDAIDAAALVELVETVDAG
jgi:hypothetical protein